MTEEASADDFQVCNPLKKKKKKHKRYKTEHENGEEVVVQDAELTWACPQPFEDQVEQSCEVTKKKKKKKKKHKEEKEQSLLDDSCTGLEHEVRDDTVMDISQKKKKKKKKKEKLNDSTESQNEVTCVAVNEHHFDSCQESGADYIYLKKSGEKKKKRKLPEEDEVSEPPALETHNETGHKRPKKKKRRESSAQDTQKDTDATADLSLLSPPEENGQEEVPVLPSTTEDGGVAVSLPEDGGVAVSLPEDGGVAVSLPEDGGVAVSLPEDGGGDASCAVSEGSVDEAADFSTPVAKARKGSRKVVKSSVYVLDDSSSESDIMTPETTALNGKEDQNSSFTETVAADEAGLDDEDCLDSSMFIFLDLDTAKKELEEFIPHVRQMSDNSIRKMAGRDLMRFKQFKKQGIAVKFGRFSEKENNQIKKNIEEFLAMTGIDSAEKLLFTSRYPEEKETISRLKAEYLFCEKLGEGISRPWRLIYYRARKIFDPNNYKGRYTEEEKEKLKKYHALHGNDWKKISEMMSRSNLSVAMKYSEIKSPINYGPWSKTETQKLMRAVEEVIVKRVESEDANSLSSSGKSHRNLFIGREKLLQKLPWTEIEAKVGTRYWRQCKQKWTSILTHKMTKGQQLYKGTKGLQAKINLIKRLHEMKVEDANEVNWEELSNIIGDVPKGYVQAKFYKLKITYVPRWRKKSFSKIIDHLFKKALPNLEEKLQKSKGKQLDSANSTVNPQKKVFQLSDIFDSSEDSDD